MKAIISILAAVLATMSAFAQGTFSVTLSGVNEVPPNSSLNSGNGQFTLSGNLLSWSIGCPDLSFTPLGGNVYGPATTSQTAPAIFSLGTPTTGPGPQGGTLTLYSGSTTLTAPQITDLQSELWYVNILSDQFPDGEIRGQILTVPEPSILGLLGVAGVMLFGSAFRRRKRSVALVAAGLVSVAGLSGAKAQGIIDSATTTGPVTVAPGGTPSGQFVAPWVDIAPTMPYVDGLPVIQEPPRPLLPGNSAQTSDEVAVVPEPSTATLFSLSAGVLVFLLFARRSRTGQAGFSCVGAGPARPSGGD